MRTLVVPALLLLAALAACAPPQGEVSAPEPGSALAEEGLAPAGAGAEVVSTTFPDVMAPGDSGSFQVVLRNSGVTEWDAADQLRLYGAASGWAMAARRVGAPVAPGETSTFDVFVTAPASIGASAVGVRLYSSRPEARGFFGDGASKVVSLDPEAEPGLHASLVGSTLPAMMAPGERRWIELSITNDGTETWQAGEVWLKRAGAGTLRWGGRRLPDAVAAGEVATVGLVVQAPQVAGAASLIGQLFVDRGAQGGFIQSRISIPTLVVEGLPAELDAAVVAESIPTELVPGETATFEITMGNSGAAQWVPELVLSSIRPGVSWRVGQVELGAAVNPGGQHTFQLSVRAPSTPGTYESRWQLRELGASGIGYFGAVSSVLVQVAALDTTLTSTPAAVTTETEATFELAATHVSASFECALDGGAWAACTSPHVIAGLSPGQHTFAARAVKGVHRDATPATFTWTISTGEPVLANGDFESGDYQGWSFVDGQAPTTATFGVVADGAAIEAGSSIHDFEDGLDVAQGTPGLPATFDAPEGDYSGILLVNGPGEHRMYQDVTLPECATTFSGWVGYQNHHGDFHPEQRLVISLRDPGNDAPISVLYETLPGDPSASATAPISVDVSALAGQTVRLDLNLIAYHFYFDVHFDAFAVTCEQD